MARSIAGAGFDTWILEVRGSGLSKSEEELADEGKASETSNGVVVEKNMAPENDTVNPSTMESKNLTSEERALPETDSTPDKPTIEERSVAELDSVKKRPRGPSSEELDVESVSKKSSQPENGTVASADSDNKLEVSEKSEGTATSWETWTTTTELNNLIMKMSNKLSSLLSQGQSKILSTRFIDSVAYLVEESALSKRITELRGRLASLLETQENRSAIMNEVAELRKKLSQLLEDGQDVVLPRVTDLQERLNNTVDDFQKVVDLIAKYDWDFDNYLDEDVPTAVGELRAF